VCVCVALFIQHEKCMRRIMSSVACPAQPHFSALSHKRQDFREKVIENDICMLIFSTDLFAIFLILRRTERGIIKNVHRCSCEVTVFLIIR
jgi:hypothetical protein